MQISNQKINSIKRNNDIKRDNNINFNGYGTSPRSLLVKRGPEQLCRDCSYWANALGEQVSTIRDLLENAPQKRIAFFDGLATNFNARNYMLDPKLKESAEPVINIYKMVKNPEPEHFNILSRSEMPFETLEQIFTHAQDKKSVDFVQKMQHDILDGSKESGEHIVKMLTSPNKKAYISNPEEYSSYIKLHSNNENAVDILDIMISNRKYDRKSYDAICSVNEMMKNKKCNELFRDSKKALVDNYSPEGKIVMDRFVGDYLTSGRECSKYDKTDLIHVYSTTNENNLKARLDVLDKFKNAKIRDDYPYSDISSIRTLFDRMDGNRRVAEFVDKALGDGIKVENPNELVTILDVIPATKAAVFHKNISRIVANTNLEERTDALIKNVENPNYKNPRIEQERANSLRPPKKDNIMYKLYNILENKFNKDKYTRLLNIDQILKEQDNVNKMVFSEYIPERRVATVTVPSIAETLSRPVEVISMPKIVGTIPKYREVKKLEIQKDVNNVIERKLGEKTLEKQHGIFTQNATMMRLKILPEIFDSISVSRKEQKAMGKKPNIANRDAVKLYSRIKGKNKKLVHYMLNQTDAQGRRIYDVKDVIRVIDDAEGKILNMKKQNPQFRAKDAKAYYDEIYNAQKEQYGNLKRGSRK